MIRGIKLAVLVTVFAVFVVACGGSDEGTLTSTTEAGETTTTEATTTEAAEVESIVRLLAPIAAGEGMFFHGFALGAPGGYWADDAEWTCIISSVVPALDTPSTHDAYSQLLEMASSPSDSTKPYLDEQAVFAELPKNERIRIGEVAIAAAQRCGDIRLNLYASSALDVCLYDRSSDELRARIVAYSLQGRAPNIQNEEEFDPEAWMIVEECWTLLQEAEDSGEELLWVTDLAQRFSEEWNMREGASGG